MSKTKLALLIMALAFGANTIAFIFSKKTFTVEEVKNLWIYELPVSSSPLDAHVALDLGPHQGIIGTLFKPDHLKSSKGVTPLLAQEWHWIPEKNTLVIKLRPGLRFQNGDPILAVNFIGLRDYLKSRSPELFSSPLWKAWMTAQMRDSGDGLEIDLGPKGISTDFTMEQFLGEVLTHPLAGAIHPKNLEAMVRGESLGKEWISSGPYKVRKWNPKEITLVSRDDFPIRLPEPFFRTLKFQSAPIKNPSLAASLTPCNHKRRIVQLQFISDALLSMDWIC
jgi:ABC-type transport system substrate-binding protein